MTTQFDVSPTTTAGDTTGSPQNDEDLMAVLQSLSLFINAFTNVVRTVNESIDGSTTKTTKPTGKTSQSAEDCTCPEPCAFDKKNAEKDQTVSFDVGARGMSNIEPPLASSTQEEIIPKETPVGDTTAGDTTINKSKTDICKCDEPGEKKPIDKSKIDSVSVDTFIEETKYDDELTDKKSQPNVTTEIEDCGCETTKSKSSIKDTTTKQSPRSQKIQKSMPEKLTKEQAEKLAELKGTVVTVQNELKEIQEQIRQLERLNQDFDTLNTPDGQVNPAALYKEIMKPQSVPYVSFTGRSSSLETSVKSPAEMIQESSSYLAVVKSQLYNEKIVVLSTVPLEESYL